MSLIVRASEASNLMVLPRSNKDKGVVLSETTKSWLKTKAIEEFYQIRSFKGNQYTEKGNLMEDKAIEMLSMLHHFNLNEYKKNEKRVTKNGFTGECDIIYDNTIIDIKCPWDLTTFPHFKEDADKGVKKSGYDWQVKVYCYLYGCEKGYVAYCMMSTPTDEDSGLLKPWDDWDLHLVDHIEPSKRVTMSSEIILTAEDVELMESQYKLAEVYYNELIEELKNK